MTSFLRPDEMASLSEIERAKDRDSTLKKGIKTAAGIGATAIVGGLSSKIMPLLSSFVPADLAVKGINKISPTLGKFLNQGQSMGLDVQGGLDFIKENLNKPVEEPSGKINIIEQYSPELHQYLVDEMDKGRSPLEAGALAKISGKFNKAISKMEKDHKAPWSSILSTVFGENVQKSAQPQAKQEGTQGLDPGLIDIMNKIRSGIQKLQGG